MAALHDRIRELDDRYLRSAADGKVAAIRGAIAGGADRNAANDEGRGALHLAVRAGHADAVRYLCEELGLDPNCRDKRGNTPLLTAFDCNRGDIAAYLAARPGVDVHARDGIGRGVVWKAAESLSLPGEGTLKAAVRLAADVDEFDVRGHTPLRLMVERRNPAGMEVLLLAGADVHARGPQAPITPLEYARRHNLQVNLPEIFAKLPRLPEELDGLTYERLVREDGNGKRLLDNPAAWRRMPEILDVLEAKGEKLPTKQDLSSGGVLEYPPLALAVAASRFGAVERCLASHGEALGAEDYWNRSRTGLGQFGKMAAEEGILQAEFSLERASSRGVEGTRDFYQALPAKGQEAIANYRQLLVQLSQVERSTEHGR